LKALGKNLEFTASKQGEVLMLMFRMLVFIYFMFL